MHKNDHAKATIPPSASETAMSIGQNIHDSSRRDDWQEQRRETRRLLRQLPPALQREIRRAYRSDIRHSVVAEVMERVLDVARARGVLQVVGSGDILSGGIEHIPAFQKRAILHDLATNRDYVRHIHRTVDERLRTAHLIKLNPDPVVIGHQQHASHEEPGQFESDRGLGTASALDEAPDQFYSEVARLATASTTEIGLTLGQDLNSAERASCLVLDPRGGALARAAATMGVIDRLQIQEVGPEFVATALPSVLNNRAGRIRPAAFDYVVWVVPTPASPGAANQIQAYRQWPEQDLRELAYFVGSETISVRAPSSLGPRRWTVAVAIILSRVVGAALKPGGTAVLRLPQAMRTSARPGRGSSAKHGCDPLPGLADPLIEALPALGFDVLDASIAVDRDPVNQPFAGGARQPWLLVKARRKGA